ncbi:hypothetical protein AB0J52_41375, partial [Spirillospora sp. NPDC049652]
MTSDVRPYPVVRTVITWGSPYSEPSADTSWTSSRNRPLPLAVTGRLRVTLSPGPRSIGERPSSLPIWSLAVFSDETLTTTRTVWSGRSLATVMCTMPELPASPVGPLITRTWPVSPRVSHTACAM